MKNSPWRQAAKEIIDQSIRQIKEVNPGIDAYTLRNMVSKRYPWGERKNHPYKMWLKEMSIAFPGNGVVKATPENIKNFWVSKGKEL